MLMKNALFSKNASFLIKELHVLYCHCHETETMKPISYFLSGFPKYRFKCAFDDGHFGNKNTSWQSKTLFLLNTSFDCRFSVTLVNMQYVVCVSRIQALVYIVPFDVIAQIYPYKLCDSTFTSLLAYTKYG